LQVRRRSRNGHRISLNDHKPFSATIVEIKEEAQSVGSFVSDRSFDITPCQYVMVRIRGVR
ncbi:MAG: hypothetical protein J7J06_03500, partial [Methanosarcinales archaeon]|nr:hypothetical protein [Methanosarcinales archaeon]